MAEQKSNRNKWLRRLLTLVAVIFFLLNVVAYFQAQSFTHFSTEPAPTTRSVGAGFSDQLKMAVFGVSIPRPENDAMPSQRFQTVKIKSTKMLEGWLIEADSANGTVILFHGYRSKKSAMLDHSDEFFNMGYNVLLVDFAGSGGSEGNQTTIGFTEGEQVRDCYEYIKNKGEENIVLCGISMGAAAITRALHEFDISPKKIILECPFGSFYEAVEGRFRSLGLSSMPMAPLLIFWGGIQNGFWAFSHNPAEYARSITAPTLLLWGERDDRVTRSETEAIFNNLQGEKEMIVYPKSGHESYLNDYREKWINDVGGFLSAPVTGR